MPVLPHQASVSPAAVAQGGLTGDTSPHSPPLSPSLDSHVPSHQLRGEISYPAAQMPCAQTAQVASKAPGCTGHLGLGQWGPYLHGVHHCLGLLSRRAVASGGGRGQLGHRAGRALWEESHLSSRLAQVRGPNCVGPEPGRHRWDWGGGQQRGRSLERAAPLVPPCHVLCRQHGAWGGGRVWDPWFALQRNPG